MIEKSLQFSCFLSVPEVDFRGNFPVCPPISGIEAEMMRYYMDRPI